MVRKALKAAVAGALGVAAIFLAHASSAAEGEAVPVKTIMQKSFGKAGYKSSIAAATKGKKWDDAAKLAKEWVALSASIGKNKPAKGEAKSWEEQCSKFCETTKAVLKATEDKDAKAVNKSLGGFNCMDCHGAHREKKKK